MQCTLIIFYLQYIHFDTTCAVQVQSLHHQLIINQLTREGSPTTTQSKLDKNALMHLKKLMSFLIIINFVFLILATQRTVGSLKKWVCRL